MGPWSDCPTLDPSVIGHHSDHRVVP